MEKLAFAFSLFGGKMALSRFQVVPSGTLMQLLLKDISLVGGGEGEGGNLE